MGVSGDLMTAAVVEDVGIAGDAVIAAVEAVAQGQALGLGFESSIDASSSCNS